MQPVLCIPNDQHVVELATLDVLHMPLALRGLDRISSICASERHHSHMIMCDVSMSSRALAISIGASDVCAFATNRETAS